MIQLDRATRTLAQGLEASSLRQQVLAHNIANANTPGFKRSHVQFESELQAALDQGKDPSAVKPQVQVESDSIGRADGNNVDVELEMTQLATNQIWNAALVRQLSDQFARLRMVIFEGRR